MSLAKQGETLPEAAEFIERDVLPLYRAGTAAACAVAACAEYLRRGCQVDTGRRDPASMVAKFNGKCQDRCGLVIYAGHDEIERGHFGFRHVDCDRARVEAWARERFAAGDLVSDIQFKLASDPHLTPEQKAAASLYALDLPAVAAA